MKASLRVIVAGVGEEKYHFEAYATVDLPFVPPVGMRVRLDEDDRDNVVKEVAYQVDVQELYVVMDVLRTDYDRKSVEGWFSKGWRFSG